MSSAPTSLLSKTRLRLGGVQTRELAQSIGIIVVGAVLLAVFAETRPPSSRPGMFATSSFRPRCSESSRWARRW